MKVHILWIRSANLKWQNLLSNPVGNNEYSKLDLSGLGNPRTVKTLQKVIQKDALIFLMETKSNLDTMKYVQNKIGFKHGLIILSEGRSGRTALLWKIESLVHIQHYSKWYIDVHVVYRCPCGIKMNLATCKQKSITCNNISNGLRSNNLILSLSRRRVEQGLN